MRILASYALTSTAGQQQERERIFDSVVRAIKTWLEDKGTVSEGGEQLALREGGLGKVVREERSPNLGRLYQITLSQHADSGRFSTRVAVGLSGNDLVVSVQLALAADALVPQRVDVRCPKVVRAVLGLGPGWAYRGSELARTPLACRGANGGGLLVSRLWDKGRGVPVICVSEEEGLVLHPGICESMAADIAGLGLVVQLDGEASWVLTSEVGKEWSCYNGAIRIYWPNLTAGSQPLDHPTWTAQRLLVGAGSTAEASRRIRGQVRRRVLAQSAFAVPEPGLLAEIRDAEREEELEELRRKSSESANDAEAYWRRVQALQRQVREQKKEIKDLERQKANLLASLVGDAGEPTEVEPEREMPPVTVKDAVDMARTAFGDTLVFGGDVPTGVEALSVDAGPPTKILSYLEALHELTLRRRDGVLAGSAIAWLEKKGVSASLESETIRKSRAKMRRRSWDDGSGVKRRFECHLKPNNATAPDRCVRIYFDFDKAKDRTIVGWVGRHP